MATTKKTTTRTRKPTAPKRPAKPKAPKAQAKPSAKAAKPKAPTKPSAPKRASKAKPKTPTAPEGPSVAELQKEIEAQRAEIDKLGKALGKAKALSKKARTPEQITEGAQIPKGDWRADYQGATVMLYGCDFDRDGELKEIDTEAPAAACFLALPRDTDVGGGGASARNRFMIAAHWNVSEDGESYHGEPCYLREDQLADVWAED